MPYELKLEKFSGPLEKLLELIEARQLEITQISMAQVTDDFLNYLRTLMEGSRESADKLRTIADFISVASRLVLIKSKYLLPDLSLTEEEEFGMKDLERRLKIYQELRPTLKMLEKLWRAKNTEFGRPFLAIKGLGIGSGSGFFYPGDGLELDILMGSINKLFSSFGDLVEETKTIKEKIVSIEEKMQEIIGRLQTVVESSFTALSGSKSRAEIVIAFLAILHLAREQLIFLEQNEGFSDIIIRNKKQTVSGN
ncbi:MAG: segregation/condensation protein A [Patescibacteria group bacterium]|nr:segregation/condensation protein A [Patescibacteria group bacterium]MDE2015830.1 segregation/condensation protein A [Patescibacteria group bacterium]MDE2227205.1 segregation/condensation protein A [Patescibacteria group bacterium]